MEKLEINRSDFGKDFLFGTATSAYQVEGATKEGGRGPSIWDEMCRKKPDKVRNYDNGDVAADSYHLYKEDVQLLKQLGFDYYRFSISWTRILPGGRLNAGVNKEGIQYYNNLINELLANGIQPFVTLLHFDVPQALEDEYGSFLDEKIVADFAAFARLCFWHFGDRVKNWITINEPWTVSCFGYAAGTFPPNRGSSSADHGSLSIVQHRCDVMHPQICQNGDPGTEPYTVTRNMLLAHAEAVRIYRQKFQSAQGGQIGITLNTTWFEPYNAESADDAKAAGRALDFTFGWFMDPVTYGQYPKSMTDRVPENRLKRFSDDESAKLKGSYDFLGLNYYTANYAYNDPTVYPEPSYLTDSGAKTTATGPDGKPIGERTSSGWIYIYPEGLFKLLCLIKTRYNNPAIYITENGVADAGALDGTIYLSLSDDIRIRYHRDHLKALKRAIDQYSVSVKGYTAWSLLDNFEWAVGYKDRFGICYVDFNDANLARYPKDSAIWFKNFLKPRPVKALSTSDNAQMPASAMELPGYETPAKRARER
ncbi:raucaffricine-O-beta-D-glucosidase [Coffea arabica]|uniref:Raucaffricine-O-beta-D-glucosidase n=1 Tax=Coffea arabica TaxID=13443 RepID=A0A6P6W246_COFAR|nr:raucaffricine-O-beta-D-glucosidase-like [Coffea arabica]